MSQIATQSNRQTHTFTVVCRFHQRGFGRGLPGLQTLQTSRTGRPSTRGIPRPMRITQSVDPQLGHGLLAEAAGTSGSPLAPASTVPQPHDPGAVDLLARGRLPWLPAPTRRPPGALHELHTARVR